MTTFTETNKAGDWLQWEVDRNFSRIAATLISGQNLKSGTVLGKITASGKYTILAPAGADGSQTADAVLLDDVDASGGDKVCTIVERFALLKSAGLTWPGGITGPQKTTATTNLLAKNLKILTSA